jgi:putative peptidoglycan lipid II flippase
MGNAFHPFRLRRTLTDAPGPMPYAQRTVASPARSPALTDNVLVATGTLLSRLTGLLRVLVLGWALIPVVNGIADGALSDAYNLANTTPNIIYELLLGGVISATLVPAFTRCFAEDDHDAIDAITGTALGALLLLAAAATLAAPLIVWVYTAFNDSDGANYQSVATSLAYFFLPQIFFYGATAVFSAQLNAQRRFFAAAWAPVLANVVIMAGLIGARLFNGAVLSLDDASGSGTIRVILGLGETMGVVVMTIALLPALRRAGVRLQPRIELRHPAVREVLRLGSWTVGYVVANQVALAVVTVLAQRDKGGLTTYLTMFIFQQLPHGLLAVTVMTTFMPDMSRAMVDHDVRAFRITLRQGMRAVLGLLAPSAVAMFVLAEPITNLAPRFADLPNAAGTLRGFAVGLLGFSAYLFVLRGFQAMKDTKTPFQINLVENAINIVLAIALVGRYGVVGLAWAFSLAYLVSAVIAWWMLDVRLHHALRTELLLSVLFRIGVAGGAMAIACWASRDLVGSPEGLGVLPRLAVSGGLGLAVYFAVLTGLGGLNAMNTTFPIAPRR